MLQLYSTINLNTKNCIRQLNNTRRIFYLDFVIINCSDLQIWFIKC